MKEGKEPFRSEDRFDTSEEQRLESLAAERLGQSPYRELHRVSCTARGNVVVLTGRVSSFYYKQLAQTQLQGKLSAGISLDNRLEVIGTSS